MRLVIVENVMSDPGCNLGHNTNFIMSAAIELSYTRVDISLTSQAVDSTIFATVLPVTRQLCLRRRRC